MIRKRTFYGQKVADVFHQERFFPAGSYSWTVPEGCMSVDVFLVGAGGGAGNTDPAGSGYTKTYKKDTSGHRNGAEIKTTPGASISIVVGKGGKGLDGEWIQGENGGYSQFMNSSYRASGGYGGVYQYGGTSYAGDGGSGGCGWYAPSDAGSDGSDGEGGPPVPGGSGQGYTTRDFGEPTAKRNAGGGGVNSRSEIHNGGASDYTDGSGGDAEGLYGIVKGGGGYGGGGSGATGSSATETKNVGTGGDGTVLIRYYAYK